MSSAGVVGGSMDGDPSGGQAEVVHGLFSSTWDIDCNPHLQERYILDNISKTYANLCVITVLFSMKEHSVSTYYILYIQNISWTNPDLRIH